MKLKIGLALYSLLAELKQDYMGTLEKVAAMGFKYIEYVGTPLSDDGKPVATPEEIGKKVKELGLIPISAHVMMNADSDLDQLIEDHVKMGSQAIIIPLAPMATKEEVVKLAAFSNEAAKKAKAKGMDFYYHNHFHEFNKFEGKYALEWLLELTDPELVHVELDTYWVKRSGIDPIEMIKQLGSRCKRIHQKDLSQETTELNLVQYLPEVVSLESVFGIFQSKTKPTDIVPVGTGALDIAGICSVTEELDFAEYIIIELDSVSTLTEENHGDGLSPLESVALSLKNLNAILN